MVKKFLFAAVVLVPVIGWALPGDVVTANVGGGYRLVFGDDPQWFAYWPSPQNSSYRVEWRDEANGLLRAMNFVTPLMPFTFAEGAGGEVLATGPDGALQRFSSAGVEDPDFTSLGGASSALSLPGGKWLINGTRRVLADGTADPSWHIPNLTRPASFSHLVSASDGGLLAVGDFCGLTIA